MHQSHSDFADAGDRRGQPALDTPLRVLVVDDEPLTRWSIAETLRASGHWVRGADSAQAALRFLTGTTESFDVVLLDYCLPDSQGWGLLTTIRRLAPRTAVLMITCESTPDMVRAAQGLGAAGVVSKPFDMNDLPGLVRDVVRSHAA